MTRNAKLWSIAILMAVLFFSTIKIQHGYLGDEKMIRPRMFGMEQRREYIIPPNTDSQDNLQQEEVKTTNSRQYTKDKDELNIVDKIRLLNLGFHKTNLMIGTPGAIEVEQRSNRRKRR